MSKTEDAYIDDWFYKEPSKKLIDTVIKALPKEVDLEAALREEDDVIDIPVTSVLKQLAFKDFSGLPSPPSLIISAYRSWHTDFEADSALYVLQRGGGTVKAEGSTLIDNQDPGSIIVLNIWRNHCLDSSRRKSIEDLWIGLAIDCTVEFCCTAETDIYIEDKLNRKVIESMFNTALTVIENVN